MSLRSTFQKVNFCTFSSKIVITRTVENSHDSTSTSTNFLLTFSKATITISQIFKVPNHQHSKINNSTKTTKQLILLIALETNLAFITIQAILKAKKLPRKFLTQAAAHIYRTKSKKMTYLPLANN
jgi:hypothetical protein